MDKEYGDLKKRVRERFQKEDLSEDEVEKAIGSAREN